MMDIGGSDITLVGNITQKEVIKIIKSFWPDLVFEDFGTDYFVYKNEFYKKAWAEDYVEEIDATMIYVMPTDINLSLVIDADKKLLPITEAIKLQMG